MIINVFGCYNKVYYLHKLKVKGKRKEKLFQTKPILLHLTSFNKYVNKFIRFLFYHINVGKIHFYHHGW